MIGATIVWTIIIEFLIIFRCGAHFRANWGTLQEVQEFCSNENPRLVGFAVTDVFADLVLLVLPIPIVRISVFPYSANLIMWKVWRLHMPVRRKVAVSGVLLLGSM